MTGNGLRALLLALLIVGSQQQSNCDETETVPFAFSDQFDVETLASYKVNGTATLADGSVVIGSGGSLVKAVRSDAKFTVDFEIKPDPEEFGVGSTHIRLLFSGGREILVAVSRRKTVHGWIRQVELVELRPGNGEPNPKIQFLRRFPATIQKKAEEHWKLKFNFGVIEVFSDESSIGTAFSAVLGSWCHAVAVVQAKTGASIQSIRFDGTAVQQTPAQSATQAKIKVLRNQSSVLNVLGKFAEWENAERAQLKLFDEFGGANFYASGVVHQRIAKCFEKQSRLRTPPNPIRCRRNLFKLIGGKSPLRQFGLAYWRAKFYQM